MADYARRIPAVSRISLRSAAPQRDGANEEGASTELEATASRILLFRHLLGAGEYSAYFEVKSTLTWSV